MTSVMETKGVTRRGVATQAWRIVEVGAFACGCTGTVTTSWHVDRRHATGGDSTGPASAEVVREFGKPCPDCRWRAMGGPEMRAE